MNQKSVNLQERKLTEASSRVPCRRKEFREGRSGSKRPALCRCYKTVSLGQKPFTVVILECP
jgi:hypothetical protein